MNNFLCWFTTLTAPLFVASISVNIDGVIDLGPNWLYQYQVQEARGPALNTPSAYSVKTHKYSVKTHKRTSKRTTITDRITKYGITETNSIFNKPRLVKEEKKINEFTYHVYKQSLRVFDEIKKKVDPKIEHKVDVLARSYDTKFREFIKDTLNQKIKTRLGTQRVVSNVIDTSNRLLRRLVNHFIADLNKEGHLRNKIASANVFQKTVDRESELELRHACTKFGFCRTSAGFSEFLTDVFSIITRCDEKKIKQAGDALTEVLKNTDFSYVMEPVTRKKFKRMIAMVESFETEMLRAMFLIGKNILTMKNRPISIRDENDLEHVNRTIVLLSMVSELDNVLPTNDENKTEWDDITASLTDWSEGKRHDILEVMQRLITYVKTKGFDKVSPEVAREFNEIFYMILS